jgi:perosamine synthetase
MTIPSKKIPRVAPKAYEYTKQVLDYGFHNAHSVGITGKLENSFAKKFGQRYGIAHCNGTATMQSALLGAAIGVGDEVIVPAFTVFSTAAVAFHVNAIPVIADVDPETWTLDIEDLKRKITPNTKAIIPVAISGLMCDMDPIMELAREHNLIVIEDNAQAVQSYYKGRVSGSIGHFASFSFQSSKTLTCGDGGMLICSDDDLALNARRAATIGFKDLSLKPGDNVVSEELRCMPDYQRHNSIGWNQRLPEIACAVALAELERVEDLTEMRQLCAKAFDEVVNDFDWVTPQRIPEGYTSSYWNYPIRIERDDIEWSDFLRKFKQLGGDGFYGAYQPTHMEPVFRNLNKSVEENPERFPHYAGKLPKYEKGYCPAWESIQPQIAMLKTNYWDTSDIQKQADILAETFKGY